jgi:hypothetical protein
MGGACKNRFRLQFSLLLLSSSPFHIVKNVDLCLSNLDAPCGMKVWNATPGSFTMRCRK